MQQLLPEFPYLKKALGPLTPEGESIISDPNIYAESTEDELVRLGPDFLLNDCGRESKKG